MYGVSAVNARG